jgi:LuxR family quorum-sensing system transcriptional regulator CciR
MRISDFIEKSNEAESSEEVFQLFQSAIAEFGFDQVAFGPVTLPAQEAMERFGTSPKLATKCSPEWYKHYMANRYMEIDPVVLVVPARRGPFLWDDLVRHEQLLPKQRQLMDESREAGLHNGVSIPIHGPQGESYVVSLATGGVAVDPRPHLRRLHALAAQFHLAYTHAGATFQEESPVLHLTERERECLTWTARGKSAWAISRILGISEHTINFHLKSAMRKLGTANRVAAVVHAIRYGMIMP